MAYQAEERGYTPSSAHVPPYYMSGRPGSARGGPAQQSDHHSSPDRLQTSHSFYKASSATPAPIPQTPYSHAPDVGPSSGHSYSQPPITPVSGPSYGPPPSSAGYYGVESTPQEAQPLPSPPASSSAERGETTINFTPDGNPIVPVGISGGKMFQCRGYGECDKVFTRSEHLARHVRKHTGERPFPCHCGKSFSRLDNLRQHAATVHSEANALNENMLMSLTTVHAALSQRASREQRKRGEIVEVPKNAVERPRNAARNPVAALPDITVAGYPPYQSDPWDQTAPPHEHPAPPSASDTDQPPQAGSGYDYQYQSDSAPPPDTVERRPGSSASYAYPQPYYGEQRPPTSGQSDAGGPIPPFYRPASSSGGPPPQPYNESEPPSSAHGPPHSPMYPHPPPHPAQQTWSSPPPPPTPYETHHHMYPPPPPESYGYTEPPPGHSHAHGPPYHHHPPPLVYGPPPPGAGHYAYPPPGPGGYYGPSQAYAHPSHPSHAHASGPPPSPYSHTHPHHAASHAHHPPPQFYPHPPPPPHSAHPSPHGPPQYQYTPPLPPADAHERKRRIGHEGEDDGSRKHPRSSHGSVTRHQEEEGQGQGQGEIESHALPPPQTQNQPQSQLPLHSNHSVTIHTGNKQDDQEPLWFPPTTERRSSLAISALLGSPQQDHRRPLPLMSGHGENGSHVNGGFKESNHRGKVGAGDGA